MIRRPPSSPLFPSTPLSRSLYYPYRYSFPLRLLRTTKSRPPHKTKHECLSLTANLGKCVGPVERSEEHTSELRSRLHLVCRLLLEKKKKTNQKLCDYSTHLV